MPTHSKKWKAFWGDWMWSESIANREQFILLYHYHHLVLVYDTQDKMVVFEWWEKPTDKRGLDAAKEYLSKL